MNKSSQKSMTEIQSELSLERTNLANRRTLLAYIRSAVALIVAGAGMMKFIQSSVWYFIGTVFIVLAPVCIAFGIADYIRMQRFISVERAIVDQYEEEESEDEDSGEMSRSDMEMDDDE